MLGALIGAGASLIGGILGRKSQADANAANIAHQKEFAQSGIQWRVEDARKAGIHPLYALGAQTHSFSPTVVGDTSLPTALAQSGQDIGRAIDATRPKAQQLEAYNQTVRDLQLQRLGLENELLASQIRKINQAGHPPGIPAGEDLIMAGRRIARNPAWSDAADIQDRYGEPAEWMYFPFVAGADMDKNIPAPPSALQSLPAEYGRKLREYLAREWLESWRGR